MHKRILMLTTVIGGIAAFLLRLAQERTGFDDAGLPIPGNVPAILLILLLLALGAALAVLIRRLPREEHGGLLPSFGTEDPAPLILPLSGVFLLFAAGGAECYAYLTGASPRRQILICGVLFAIAAVCLFPVTAACRRHDGEDPPPAPVYPAAGAVCALLAFLLIYYREVSMDPVLLAYYTDLLGLCALIACLFCLASHLVENGRLRLFTFFAAAAFLLCAATLGAPHTLGGYLLFASGCALSAGFLALRLRNL